MPDGASVAERAVGLPWIRPSSAALAALTAELPDPVAVMADPATVAHVLRYCRPTATPELHPFTVGGLSQPSLVGSAADLFERVGPHLAPPETLRRFVLSVTAVAAELSRVDGLDQTLAAAIAGLVPIGWLAVAAVEPISCAELRFRLTTPNSQQSAWGMDSVAIGRRVAARWRLPEWVTTTIGMIRLHPVDAVRSGAPERIFPVVQRAIAAVEAEQVRLGLTDPVAAARNPRWSEDLAVVRACRVEPIETSPLPDWAAVRLLRAVAASRRQSGAVWQSDADARADRLAESLAQLRTDWHVELQEAKLAGLAEFAAGASHEINNPLAVVAGHAKLLMQKETDPERRRQFATILRQTDRVHDLLRGTLHFARPPAASRSLALVSGLLAECADAHSADFQARSVKLITDTVENVTVSGDPGQLRRVIDQLLRNALDAAPTGGEVKLWAERDSERVLIRVSDSGAGPAPTAIPHLFDPFFSGKSAGRGRGLGLSIAWRLARQNGGDLRYDPTPDQPSRFTLSLPLAESIRRSA